MTTRGDVVVDADAPSITDAVVRVRVLDVTEQDTDAVVVAETERVVTHRRGSETRVAFAFDWDPKDDSRDHVLDAHVDVGGGGDVTRGDLVTVASHPVTATRPGPVVLPVRVVS